jgi:hypothetical protein
MIQSRKETDLKAVIGSSLTDEAEGSADVNLHDNIEGLVRGSVQHLVECKSGIVNDVVDLSEFPISRKIGLMTKYFLCPGDGELTER